MYKSIPSQWYKDSVALIGDAKHGVTPLSGASTTFALEDGYVLAQALNNDANHTITKALKDFSNQRARRMRTITKNIYLVEQAIMCSSFWKFTISKLLLKIFPVWLIKRSLEDFMDEDIVLYR